MSVKKHPLTIAWDKWCRSEEGQSCGNSVTLQAPATQGSYLENRLWRAFKAGIDAQEKYSRRKK